MLPYTRLQHTVLFSNLISCGRHLVKWGSESNSGSMRLLRLGFLGQVSRQRKGSYSQPYDPDMEVVHSCSVCHPSGDDETSPSILGALVYCSPRGSSERSRPWWRPRTCVCREGPDPEATIQQRRVVHQARHSRAHPSLPYVSVVAGIARGGGGGPEPSASTSAVNASNNSRFRWL